MLARVATRGVGGLAPRADAAPGWHQELSFGLFVLFWDRVRFLLEPSRVDVQANTPVRNQPKPLPVDPYLALDHERLSGQLGL